MLAYIPYMDPMGYDIALKLTRNHDHDVGLKSHRLFMLQRQSLGGFRVKSSPYFPPKIEQSSYVPESPTGWWFGTFFIFPFSWEFHNS